MASAAVASMGGLAPKIAVWIVILIVVTWRVTSPPASATAGTDDIFLSKILSAWSAAKAVRMSAVKEETARAKADILAHAVTGSAALIAKGTPVTLTGDVRFVNLVSMMTVVVSRVVRAVLNVIKRQARVAVNAEKGLSGKIAKVSVISPLCLKRQITIIHYRTLKLTAQL